MSEAKPVKIPRPEKFKAQDEAQVRRVFQDARKQAARDLNFSDAQMKRFENNLDIYLDALRDAVAKEEGGGKLTFKLGFQDHDAGIDDVRDAAETGKHTALERLALLLE